MPVRVQSPTSPYSLPLSSSLYSDWWAGSVTGRREVRESNHLLFQERWLYLSSLRAVNVESLMCTRPSANSITSMISFNPHNKLMRTFLVMQRIGIHLPMQGTLVQSLVWEDAKCSRKLSPYATTAKPAPQSWKAATTEPVCCNH